MATVGDCWTGSPTVAQGQSPREMFVSRYDRSNVALDPSRELFCYTATNLMTFLTVECNSYNQTINMLDIFVYGRIYQGYNKSITNSSIEKHLFKFVPGQSILTSQYICLVLTSLE